jgi:hypothetical protein
MTPEPLKGKEMYWDSDKGDSFPFFEPSDVKSAVSGLIKFHEDRIEKLIKTMETYNVKSIDDMIRDDDIGPDTVWAIGIMNMINNEYESINAIEHWLEDVI